MKRTFGSLSEFYPYYLSQHKNRISRLLHAFGVVGGVTVSVTGILTAAYMWIPFGIVLGYACGWIGHFVFEGNRPATFGYPIYSFICDFRMSIDTLRGRL